MSKHCPDCEARMGAEAAAQDFMMEVVGKVDEIKAVVDDAYEEIKQALEGENADTTSLMALYDSFQKIKEALK